MTKNKDSDILRRHVVADVQLKKLYADGDDPKSYTERMSKLTATGSIFLQKGMYREAIDCFCKALAERQDDFWATFYLGSIALEINQPAYANYYLKACLEEAPEDWNGRPLALTNYSGVQFKLGDFEGAESSIEEALEIDPTLDRPYNMMAIHKIYRGQYQEALEIVNRGLKKVPGSKLLKRLDLDIKEIMENQG